MRGLLFAAFLGFFVSALHLAVPLFMLQVYDRVIGSRSLDTLTALAVITLAALALYGNLDFIRGRTYHVLGNTLADCLGKPVIRNAVRDAARGGRASVSQALRDVSFSLESGERVGRGVGRDRAFRCRQVDARPGHRRRGGREAAA